MLIKKTDFDDDDERPEILKEKGQIIANMYDESPEPGSDGLYGLQPNTGLTEKELELLPLYASLSRGMMVVTGAPGSGKGVFSNHLAWENRRLFKKKKVILDYKPRALFDLGQENNRYLYFDSAFFDNEVAKMAEQSGVEIFREGVATGKKKISQKQMKENTQELAKEWIRQNELLFLDAHMNLDEFKKYFHNRNPFNPMGMKLGYIIAVWRHLKMLILGMCPYLHEIDQFSVIPYMSHEVKCSWGLDGNTVFASFYKKKMVTSKGVIGIEGKPIRIKVNGRKPLPEIGVQLLGDFDTTDLGVKEAAIIEYLKTREKHLANLNMINDNAVDEDINVLSERLIFMHKLGIVECKSFFKIFNSVNVIDPTKVH